MWTTGTNTWDALPGCKCVRIIREQFAELVMNPEVISSCSSAFPISERPGSPFGQKLIARMSCNEPGGKLAVVCGTRKGEEPRLSGLGNPFVQGNVTEGRRINPDTTILMQEEKPQKI